MRLLLAFALLSSAACSSGDTTPSTAKDSGVPTDGSVPDASSADTSTPVDSGGGGDSGGLPVEGCNTFEDHTATSDSRTISPWDPSLGKKCYTIKVGQSVTWSPSPSSANPLVATGGTKPSPILGDNAAVVAFPNQGTYGFQCAVHLSLMHGAIQVVP
jgi:hypothetical protein